MSYSIKNGTTIVLTRGDSFYAAIEMYRPDGQRYYPNPGDKIRFALKKTVRDQECKILKEIPTDTMVLNILPEETKNLSFGDYVYDIQLTTSSGDVDTFITKSPFQLTEEVE